ncbi:hypothetical protein HZA56_05970 [Candidatus Poribacteria bacterium]|nr:hypothetical protein [Candidatus Poribacteria bacterium]
MKKIPVALRRTTLVLVLIVLVRIYFGECVGFYFVCDDFALVERGLWPFPLLLKYTAGSHWIPAANVFFHALYCLFGTKYSLWHFVSLALHVLNAYLVMLIAFRIFRNEFVGILSSIIFLTFSMNYEAVIWITGLCNLLMTLAYLLTLICFDGYLRSRRPALLAATALLMLVSLSTLESSIFLIIMLFAWELLVHNPRDDTRFLAFLRNLRSNVLKYFLLGALMVLFLLFRLSILDFTMLAQASVPSLAEIPVNYARAVAYLVFPYIPALAVEVGRDNIVGVFVALLAVLSFVVRKYRKCRFPIVAVFIALTPTLLLSFIQARYLYLSSAFSSILFGAAIAGLGDLASRGVARAHAAFSRPAYVKLVVVALLCPPILFMEKQMLERRMQEWRKASEWSIRIDEFIRERYRSAEDLSDKMLVFVNMPDGVPSVEVWPAYVARTSMQARVNLLMGRIMNNVKTYALPADILTAFTASEVFADAPRIDRQTLTAMCSNPSYNVYTWDPAYERLKEFCR